MNPVIICCDPGASGSVAWSHGGITMVRSMPETRRDCIDLISGLAVIGPAVCYIEKINPYIPDGGASQMFEFGRNVERIGCIVETLGIKLIEVPPKTWQKHFGLGNVGTERANKDMTTEERKAMKSRNARLKTEWKNKLKAEAQRRFPHLKVTLKTADALLLLEYGMTQPFTPSVQSGPKMTPSEAGSVLVRHRRKKDIKHPLGDNIDLFHSMFSKPEPF